MTTLREAAQQALEALEFEADGWEYPPAKTTDAIAALSAALAELDGRQQTHSADCWKWHHQCAIAKIKREHGIGESK